jgi:hypothetical protein
MTFVYSCGFWIKLESIVYIEETKGGSTVHMSNNDNLFLPLDTSKFLDLINNGPKIVIG